MRTLDKIIISRAAKFNQIKKQILILADRRNPAWNADVKDILLDSFDGKIAKYRVVGYSGIYSIKIK